MKKNPLLIAKTNSNQHKIGRAKKMLGFSLALLFVIAFVVTASIMNIHDFAGLASALGISTGTLAFVPLVAGVKGTKALNGIDETDEQFNARGGKAEDDAMFAKRMIMLGQTAVKELSAKFETDIASMKEEIKKAGTDAAKVALIEAELSKTNLALESIKENGKRVDESVKAQINAFIKENYAKIKEMKAKGSGVIELEIKAVGSMLTTSASNPDGIPALMGVQTTPPSNVNLRATIVENLVTRFNTSQAAYAYTESIPKDGNYAFLLEAGTKTQIDFKIESRYAEPKKVAAYILLTEESVNDIPGLQSIAENYLLAKHNLKRQNGFLFGDGTGANPKGATTYGRAFVAGSMANKVASPNFMDVVNAAITDIFTTHNYTDEMPYMANLVLVSPIDFYINLVSAKDGFGHPLYPTASLFNRVTIGGVTIVPFEDIPAGKIFVADMSKYNITDFVGYTVRIGWINDNFITNQFVMLGESRFHAFVKKLDEQAFIYDDIATIQGAITKA